MENQCDYVRREHEKSRERNTKERWKQYGK
jgi:hypothetical protein